MKASEITRLTNLPLLRREGGRWLSSSLELVVLLVLCGLLVQEVARYTYATDVAEPEAYQLGLVPVPVRLAEKPCPLDLAPDLALPTGLSERRSAEVPPEWVEPQAHRPVAGSVLHGAIVPLQ